MISNQKYDAQSEIRSGHQKYDPQQEALASHLIKEIAQFNDKHDYLETLAVNHSIYESAKSSSHSKCAEGMEYTLKERLSRGCIVCTDDVSEELQKEFEVLQAFHDLTIKADDSMEPLCGNHSVTDVINYTLCKLPKQFYREKVNLQFLQHFHLVDLDSVVQNLTQNCPGMTLKSVAISASGLTDERISMGAAYYLLTNCASLDLERVKIQIPDMVQREAVDDQNRRRKPVTLDKLQSLRLSGYGTEITFENPEMRLDLPPRLTIVDLERSNFPFQKFSFEAVKSFSFAKAAPQLYNNMIRAMTALEHLTVCVDSVGEIIPRLFDRQQQQQYDPLHTVLINRGGPNIKSIDLRVKDITLGDVFGGTFKGIEHVKVSPPSLEVDASVFDSENGKFVFQGQNFEILRKVQKTREDMQIHLMREDRSKQRFELNLTVSQPKSSNGGFRALIGGLFGR